MSNNNERVEERGSNMNTAGDNGDNDDPRETNSMRHFLNLMGESQREALEKMFSIDHTCLPSCENQIENQMDLFMVRRMLGPLSLIILEDADTVAPLFMLRRLLGTLSLIILCDAVIVAPLFYYPALSATVELLTILSTARKHVREWRRGNGWSLCGISILRILWSIHNHTVFFLLPKTKALFSKTETTVCILGWMGSCDGV
jgi:hypothetical protein